MCNQAAEAINMPYLDAKSMVFPIELIFSNVAKSIEIIDKLISKNCRCIILDTPLVVNTRYRYQEYNSLIKYVIGPGSIVCRDDCEIVTNIELAEKCWVSGAYISAESKCITYMPSSSYLDFLKKRITNIEEVYSLDVYLDSIQRSKENGVAVLHTGLEVQESRIRGRLSSRNPLHPAGVIGKFEVEIELKRHYNLLGPYKRLVHYILTIDENPLISEVIGLGKGLILHYDPIYESSILLLVAYLSTLYECGEYQK